MAYSVEKDLENMDRKKKAIAKSGKKRQDKIAAKKKGKKKKKPAEDNWATRLKTSVQMLLKGEDYVSPAMKKKKKKK